MALAIALAARRAHALSATGAACATIVGTLCVAAGWDWGALLIAFFLASTLLSRLGRAVKDARTGSVVAKGGARDAVQVLANGGVFTACAVAFIVHPAPVWQALGAGALAASTSDTWATEVGTLVATRPRSIRTGRVVPPGTSGGVSLPGTLAAVAGAIFVAGTAVAMRWPLLIAIAAVVGGVIGSTVDSILGATVQARRWCAKCGAATERAVHSCGAATTVVGGVPWLTNNGVNTVSSALGAAASVWGGIAR